MWNYPKSPLHQAAIDNQKLDRDREIARATAAATKLNKKLDRDKPLRKHLRNTKWTGSPLSQKPSDCERNGLQELMRSPRSRRKGGTRALTRGNHRFYASLGFVRHKAPHDMCNLYSMIRNREATLRPLAQSISVYGDALA